MLDVGYWFGIGLGFKIGWRRVMEDRRMKKEGRRKAYYPVWQAF